MTDSDFSIHHPLVDGDPPEWATAWGQDAFGIFCELTLSSDRAQPAASQRLRWIPAGSFTMGSPPDEPGHHDDEGPQHVVWISQGFWIFDTPCPQSIWSVVMHDNPSQFQDPERPVEKVSWLHCLEFADRVSELNPHLQLTLPTEAEWEYCCRAGSGTATYLGDLEIVGTNHGPNLDSIAWYSGNTGVDYDLHEFVDSMAWPEKQYAHHQAGTRKLAQKQSNAWGLYDMLGNVWEWCRDGPRTYAPGRVVDPVGPTHDRADRVMRGGSWFGDAEYNRCAFRASDEPTYHANYLGFRPIIRFPV